MSDLSTLQREKAELEATQIQLVGEIHGLRQRARAKSLEASSTKVPLAQSEIEFWKVGIAKCQSELMAVQAKLGEVGKQLRKGKVDRSIRSLSQLPRPNKADARPHDSDPDRAEEVYLSCFHTICKDSLDPRLFEALERDTRALAEDYRKMHREKS